MFSKKELTVADQAIKLNYTIGRPGYEAYFNILKRGLIHNCKVNAQDAKNA